MKVSAFFDSTCGLNESLKTLKNLGLGPENFFIFNRLKRTRIEDAYEIENIADTDEAGLLSIFLPTIELKDQLYGILKNSGAKTIHFGTVVQ